MHSLNGIQMFRCESVCVTRINANKQKLRTHKLKQNIHTQSVCTEKRSSSIYGLCVCFGLSASMLYEACRYRIVFVTLTNYAIASKNVRSD